MSAMAADLLILVNAGLVDAARIHANAIFSWPQLGQVFLSKTL